MEAGHTVDVISGPPYPHLDPRVRLIQLPSMDLFENGLLSLRPRHLSSLTDMMEWGSKLTGGFAEPYTFGRRAVQYLREHGRTTISSTTTRASATACCSYRRWACRW